MPTPPLGWTDAAPPPPHHSAGPFGSEANGGTVHPAIAALCRNEQELARIERETLEEIRENGDDPSISWVFVATSDARRHAFIFKTLRDLNSYHTEVAVLDVPEMRGEIGDWFEWYVACGRARYYRIFQEYAATFTVQGRYVNGWSPITLHLPRTNSFGRPIGGTKASTYYFGETGYVPANPKGHRE